MLFLSLPYIIDINIKIMIVYIVVYNGLFFLCFICRIKFLKKIIIIIIITTTAATTTTTTTTIIIIIIITATTTITTIIATTITTTTIIINLSRTDGKRPGGLTLVPWQVGKNLVWNVTVIDAIANSYLTSTSLIAGRAAAKLAASRKEEKYVVIASTYIFVLLTFETLGPICSKALVFLKKLSFRYTLTISTRQFSYFKSCLLLYLMTLSGLLNVTLMDIAYCSSINIPPAFLRYF